MCKQPVRLIDEMDAPSAIATCRQKISFLADFFAVGEPDLSSDGVKGLHAILCGIEEDIKITEGRL